MTANRRTRVIIVTLVALLITIAAWLLLNRTHSTEPNQLTRLRIAQAGDFFLYAPLYVAVDAGFFEQRGLEVSITSTGGDDKTWAAVVSGDARFGVAEPTFVVISEQRGEPGKVVGSIVNGVPFWGVTYDPSITVKADGTGLGNLVVGTFPSPSTAYTLQKRMFTEAGLPPNIREGAFGTMLAMLQAGQVDIALELEPNVSQAVNGGAHIAYSMAEQYGDFAITGLTTTPEIITNEEPLLRSVLCGLQLALDYIRQDREGTLRILNARFPEVSRDVASNALDRVVAEGIVPKSVAVEPEAWKQVVGLRQEVGDITVDAPYEKYVFNVAATWASTARECKYGGGVR